MSGYPTPTAEQAKNPYGKYGNLLQRVGTGSGSFQQTTPDLSDLPDWLAAQYTLESKTDEGGTTTPYWTFGKENPWSGFKGEDGQSMVQVGDPRQWTGNQSNGSQNDGEVIDPTKVKYDANLGWVTAADNLHDAGTAYNAGDWERFVATGVAVVAGGYLAANGLVAAAGAGEGAGAGAGTGIGADESAGLSMTPPGGGAPPPTPLPETLPPPEVTPAPAVPEVTPPPTPTTPPPDPTLPPGTQPPAPVTDAVPPTGTQPPAPVTNATPAQPGTGVINTVRNVTQPVTDWYNGLSTPARMVLNQGVSSASNALTSALRQRSAQQAANEQEQRARDDIIRRGQVPVPSGNPYTPKPNNPLAGIINGARKGP